MSLENKIDYCWEIFVFCEIWVHFSSRDVLNFLWNMHSLSWFFFIFFIPWMTVAFVIFEERISLAPLMSYTLPRTRIWVTPIQILNLRLVQAWFLCLNLQVQIVIPAPYRKIGIRIRTIVLYSFSYAIQIDHPWRWKYMI